jgi:hypothetical protein
MEGSLPRSRRSNVSTSRPRKTMPTALFRVAVTVALVIIGAGLLGSYLLGALNAHAISVGDTASTLPDIYTSTLVVGNASCSPSFQRLPNGLIGQVRSAITCLTRESRSDAPTWLWAGRAPGAP